LVPNPKLVVGSVQLSHLAFSRAANAGIETAIGCHTFRVTGITDYLINGGRIEVATGQHINKRPRGTVRLFPWASFFIHLAASRPAKGGALHVEERDLESESLLIADKIRYQTKRKDAARRWSVCRA